MVSVVKHSSIESTGERLTSEQRDCKALVCISTLLLNAAGVLRTFGLVDAEAYCYEAVARIDEKTGESRSIEARIQHALEDGKLSELRDQLDWEENRE